MAELIIYFFEPDPTTTRLDDYVLRRQVNDAAPEVLARNLMKQGSTPFFRYFGKRRYTSQVSELDSVPDSDLPAFPFGRDSRIDRGYSRQRQGRTASVRCA